MDDVTGSLASFTPQTEELTQLLLGDHDLKGVVQALSELAAQNFSSDRREVVCGVILKRDKKNAAVASSSARARTMDEVQADLDEGPCLEAQQKGAIVAVPDLRYEKRWPAYMGHVRSHGLLSVVAIPLVVHGTSTAAMNFYAEEPHSFTEEDVAVASRYAELASSVLTIALRVAFYADDAEDRRLAMEARTSIDIAVGVIMGQNQCSQDEAVRILKGASNHRNIKLRTLADQLISSMGQKVPATSFDS